MAAPAPDRRRHGRAGQFRVPRPPISPATAPTSNATAAGCAAPRSTRCFYRPHAPRRPTRSGRRATPDVVPLRGQAAEGQSRTSCRLARSRAPLERFLDETGATRRQARSNPRPAPAVVRLRRARGRPLPGAAAGRATTGPVVCEPRHATWASAAADALLSQHRRRPRRHRIRSPFPEAAVAGRLARAGLSTACTDRPDRPGRGYDALRLGAWADALRRVPDRRRGVVRVRQHGVGCRASERRRARRPAAAGRVINRSTSESIRADLSNG